MANGIKINWTEEHKPQLNTWYRCRRRDDWYKILKAGHYNGQVLYNVVSYREGKEKFVGLTLAQARTAIRIETYLSTTYGG